MITTSTQMRAAAGMYERYPQRWTQGTYARNKEGRAIGYTEPRRDARHAACLCLTAVIVADEDTLPSAYKVNQSPAVQAMLARAKSDSAVHEWEKGSLSAWNDVKGRTVREVIELLRRAADDIEAQP